MEFSLYYLYMERMLYSWQRPAWPRFTWNEEKIQKLLCNAVEKKAYFLGKISMIAPEMKVEISTGALEDEIISSNSIENITLKRESVRSSILSRLGFENENALKADHYTEGAVSITVDAVENHDMMLTKERLFGWHTELFPSGFSDGRRILTGCWRQGEMYVVSGRTGKEVIHYEAPPADRIDREMDVFLKFVNEDELNPVLKAAVAHFWFVTIHPFADGNGRIARTITEMLLARADNSERRYYSLSAGIRKNRKEYYDVLEYCQKSSLDITKFMEYFLTTLEESIDDAEEEIAKVIRKTQFWDSLRMISLNEREIGMINRLFDGFQGKLTTEKWAKITKCSHSTALRDIKDLLDKEVLEEDGGNGRNTGYRLKL